MGLTSVELGSLIGYEGNDNTKEQVIRRYENGTKEIPLYLARYLWLLTMLRFQQQIAIRADGTPFWPKWLRHKEHADVDPE